MVFAATVVPVVLLVTSAMLGPTMVFVAPYRVVIDALHHLVAINRYWAVRLFVHHLAYRFWLTSAAIAGHADTSNSTDGSSNHGAIAATHGLAYESPGHRAQTPAQYGVQVVCVGRRSN